MKGKINIITAIAIMFCVIFYNHFISDDAATPARKLTELDDLQKQVLLTLNEMTKLLMALSTAMFGLIGFFAQEKYKSNGFIDERYGIDMTLAFCSVIISIDFGYVFMDKWVEMLSQGVFKPYDKMVILPQRLQVMFFIVAMFFAAKMVFRNFFIQKIEKTFDFEI